MNDTISRETSAASEHATWTQFVGTAVPEHTRSGMYVHVPYCASRCGYCDFNTYTPREIDLASSEYATVAVAEIEAAGRSWSARNLETVFIGGGTPTLLEVGELTAIIDSIERTFGLAAGAEITIEANPDSVDLERLRRLRSAGVTRVSFGVQSLSEAVLATLDRSHTPGRAIAAIREAHEAGFAHVSADLIYATPGETDDDLERSVESVLAEGVDHLSAYSLIVEPGTRLAARVARGELPAVDDDVAAHRYGLVDGIARRHGLEWYEVSNWARPGGQCRHNLAYWRGEDWWAIGPGAHGHVRREGQSMRWWNLKHPTRHAAAVRQGEPPIDGWEIITGSASTMERIMLGLRLREGLSADDLPRDSGAQVAELVDRGLLQWRDRRVALTDSGRLFADAVIRDLV